MPRGRNDYETAQIQGRLWTPAVLRPAAWWDAADLATIAYSGSAISQWSDKSGNGIHATGGAQILEAISQNGLPGIVTAPGSNSSFAINSAGTASRSMIVATRPKVTGGGTGFRGLCATGASSGSGSAMYSNNGANKWGTWSSVDYSGGIQLVAGTPYLLCMDGLDSGSFYRNGASDGTYAATEGQGQLAGSASMGHIGGQIGQSGTTQKYDGTYFEIVWMSSAMTAPQRQALEGYLSWKWGIPLAADHPFANRPPLIGD